MGGRVAVFQLSMPPANQLHFIFSFSLSLFHWFVLFVSHFFFSIGTLRRNSKGICQFWLTVYPVSTRLWQERPKPETNMIELFKKRRQHTWKFWRAPKHYFKFSRGKLSVLPRRNKFHHEDLVVLFIYIAALKRTPLTLLWVIDSRVYMFYCSASTSMYCYECIEVWGKIKCLCTLCFFIPSSYPSLWRSRYTKSAKCREAYIWRILYLLYKYE